jgi:glucose-1-phosphate thymidylyltransferase
MNALILAAGYGTRMKSVSAGTPKPLLQIAGRAVIDYLLDQLKPIRQIDRMVLVTNDLFHGRFVAWARERGLNGIEILNDGTRCNEERLGAIGDLQFSIEQASMDDDLLVAGADNIFRFDVSLLVEFFLESGSDVIAVVRETDRSRLAKTSTLKLDEDGRVVEFVEKAPEPISDLICPPLYIFRQDTLALVRQYLDAGGPPDAPGHLIAWLHKQRPVYGRLMPRGRHDIGSPETYREAREAIEE